MSLHLLLCRAGLHSWKTDLVLHGECRHCGVSWMKWWLG